MDKKSVKPLEELLDSVRDIDGFPIGKDEDILALSDPPFYTACPNPYIKQFIEEYGKPYDPENDDYHREPFVGDVSEGKNDPIYNAHSYHTKVPHKAIMKYIEHYTEEGDIVFDGFCGSGMTGIACKETNRYGIISDLSPAATFMSYNYNSAFNKKRYDETVKKILKELEDEIGWLYKTKHSKNALNAKTGKSETTIDLNSVYGRTDYVVWNDIYVCPYCEQEYNYYDVAIDKETGKTLDKLFCPHCSAELSKNELKHSIDKKFDNAIGEELYFSKQQPILITYKIGNKTYEKKPDKDDIQLLEKIENMEIPYLFPKDRMPEGDESRRNDKCGITHVHHFFTKRNLWALSALYDKIMQVDDGNLRKKLLWAFTGIQLYSTKMNRYTPSGIFGKFRPLIGTLYIASMFGEMDVVHLYKNKALLRLSKIIDVYKNSLDICVSTQSATDLSNIPSNSIDYVFTDPPFGSNLMYSELNFIWEAWLKCYTNNSKEAIINNTQKKDIHDYSELMRNSFKEYNRILKPNRWMTVEFHNSKASVWQAIQQAIVNAGFVIAQVSVLDKKYGTFKQIASAGAVKNDLIINAYKPKKEFSERFLKNAGEGMEVDFVIQQLKHLPVKPNIERTEKMLYSRMLAHYVENGFKIKYDSTDFYKLLSDNFTELDGYWFLDSQVKEYNEWKSGLSLDQMKEVLGGQQVILVSDEKSAIIWMYNFLHTPRDYGEIYTAYQQVATKTDDVVPEPKELLDNNFILENGKYRRPVSREEKEEINKNRERELEHAFSKLLRHAKEQKGKIRNVRQEALVHGFTRCYQEGRYQDILTIANKLYASTLESSGDIMDFVDIARIKTSGEN